MPVGVALALADKTRCYILAWSTAYSVQAGLVGVIFGLLMLIWYFRYEDRGENAPLFIGYVLFAPPLTLILIGAIWWLLKRLGWV